MKVYVSGPISGLPEAQFRANFAEGVALLESKGFEAVNPLDVIPACGETCESNLAFGDGSYQHSWGCYMKYDIIALLDCGAIFMLPIPGTRESKGAKLELTIARSLGLMIFTVGKDGDLEC